MTYFVEGIQGSGKSTLVKLFSERFPEHKVLEEGDYSPVELAWCAYMGMEDYRAALEKHSSLKSEIEAKTHFEDDHVVVCYTKIRTEDGLVRHWTHRQDLELRICEELFPGRYTVLSSKSYGDDDIDKL